MNDEGRYSKVTRRMWNDEKFRALSRAEPNAQTLWMRLLTGPELGAIPGLFVARLGGLSEALQWSRQATERCWKEIVDRQMATADWIAGLVWVPNAFVHNEPSSPNTVASWRKTGNELPECALRADAFALIEERLATMGPPWVAAWRLAENAESKSSRITSDVRRIVQTRDGNRCRYCAKPVDWSNKRGPFGATYDHVDPTGDASIQNIVVACRSCNSKKGFRTPLQAGLTLLVSGSETDSSPNQKKPDVLDLNQEQDQEQDQEHDSRERGTPRASEPGDPLLESLTAAEDELPVGWQPNTENRALALRLGLDCDEELGMYSAHRRRAGFRCGAWDADFELWLRRTAKMNRERAAGAAKGNAPLQAEQNGAVTGWENVDAR